MTIKTIVKPPLYAVMGNPITHSLSPTIHLLFASRTGLSLRYEKIRASEALFEQEVLEFFNDGGKGLNITLPFKERAFAMAHVQSARAKEAGAANTLWMQDGVLHADNTDGIGLIRDLNQHIHLANKTILLLGAGGAARSIIGALLQAKPLELILCNRTIAKAHLLQTQFPSIITCTFEALDKLTEPCDLIINATSASLANERLPLPETLITHHPVCYDLAYAKNNTTTFVQWAKTQGCEAFDGIGMLIEQAAEAFYIWHGIRPDTKNFNLTH